MEGIFQPGFRFIEHTQTVAGPEVALRPGPQRWPKWATPVVVSAITVLLATLAVMAVSGVRLPFRTYTFHGLVFGPPLPAPDFVLTNQDGQPVHLRDYRGKLVVLVFGYTHCPDACPITLSKLKRVLTELGDASDQVQVLLVSVDPEQDTPAVLKEYLSRFSPAFVGLTGRPEEIEAVTRAYGVHVEKEGSPDGDLVAHTALTYVIDRSGQQVLAFPIEIAPQEMAADLQYLLRR